MSRTLWTSYRFTRMVIVAAAVFLLPATVSAVMVTVSYPVEEKPLKTLHAGSTIYFEIYEESSCTSSSVAVPVLIENIEIIAKVKQLTPKGDVKLPNTVELRTTLDTTSLSGALFVSVALQAGVVPVGAPCRPLGNVGLLSSQSIYNPSVGTIPASPDWQFVGPQVGLLPFQRAHGTVTAWLGKILTGPTFKYDLCYLGSAFTVTPFTGGLTVTGTGSTRQPYTASASANLPDGIPPDGVYVGFCVQTSAALDLNGGVSGWVRPERVEF